MKRKKLVFFCLIWGICITFLNTDFMVYSFDEELLLQIEEFDSESFPEPDIEPWEMDMMSSATVKTYSKASQGSAYLSDNFKVSEFACKDGSDTILIDTELVTILQNIRDHFGVPVTITSGYRTPSHNAAVGGASGSYHVKGMAADIQVSGVSAAEVAKYAETIGVRGVGKYSNFVHVDTRPTKYYWTNSGSSNVTVTTHGGTFNQKPYVHVHSYTSIYEDAHPHKERKVCSCGDYYYTGGVTLVSSCNQCFHTHKYENIDYEAVHPHREYTYCSCGATNLTGNTGTSDGCYEAVHPHREYIVCKITTCSYHRTLTGNTGTTTKNETTYPYKEYYVCPVSCSYNNTYTGEDAIPPKPSLNNFEKSHTIDEEVVFSWDESEIATHYNIYIDKLVNGEYDRVKTIFYAENNEGYSLESGKYRMILQATNSNYWTEDGSTWVFKESGWIYFDVSDRKTPRTTTTLSDDDTGINIYTELYNLNDNSEVVFAGYYEKKLVSLKIVPANASTDFLVQTLAGKFDKIKIMMWEDSELVPMFEGEVFEEHIATPIAN